MPSILRNLKILEVSSVDRGAGDGVRIVLMKRDDETNKAWGADHLNAWTADDLPLIIENPGVINYAKRTFTAEQRQASEDKGHAMSGGGFPIENVADLKNAIQAVGRAKNPAAAKAHIKRRAEALGQSDLIPDTWKRVQKDNADEVDLSAIQLTKAKEIDAMTLDELNKLIGDQVSKAITEMTIKLPELVSKAVTEAVKKVKPGSKGRFDSNPDAEHDGGDKERMSAEEDCDAETKKALEIAKLSPEVRKIIDEADKNASLVKKFMEKQELDEFAKRAVGMGLKKEDGVLLQKAYKGDAASQKVLEERMATVAKAATAQRDTSIIFAEFGANNGNSGAEGASAYDQLMAKARELKAKDSSLSEAQAYTKVSSDPANRELAMQESRERLAKVQRMPVN